MTLTVVLDVNILASAATSEHGLPRVVLRAGLRLEYRLVRSDHIIAKLRETFSKPYFADRLSVQDQELFIVMLVWRSEFHNPDLAVRNIAPDLEDDLVLGTAVGANANFLVTGDKGLLAVGEYRGVRIVTAAEFLEELERA